MNASVNDKLYLLSACNNNSPSAYSKCFLINAFLQEKKNKNKKKIKGKMQRNTFGETNKCLFPCLFIYFLS